jgi:hypothetical protein
VASLCPAGVLSGGITKPVTGLITALRSKPLYKNVLRYLLMSIAQSFSMVMDIVTQDHAILNGTLEIWQMV